MLQDSDLMGTGLRQVGEHRGQHQHEMDAEITMARLLLDDVVPRIEQRDQLSVDPDGGQTALEHLGNQTVEHHIYTLTVSPDFSRRA